MKLRSSYENFKSLTLIGHMQVWGFQKVPCIVQSKIYTQGDHRCSGMPTTKAHLIAFYIGEASKSERGITADYSTYPKTQLIAKTFLPRVIIIDQNR